MATRYRDHQPQDGFRGELAEAGPPFVMALRRRQIGHSGGSSAHGLSPSPKLWTNGCRKSVTSG
jgi:hypothetical protein